jgi:hypothetical protein
MILQAREKRVDEEMFTQISGSRNGRGEENLCATRKKHFYVRSVMVRTVHVGGRREEGSFSAVYITWRKDITFLCKSRGI